MCTANDVMLWRLTWRKKKPMQPSNDWYRAGDGNGEESLDWVISKWNVTRNCLTFNDWMINATSFKKQKN